MSPAREGKPGDAGNLATLLEGLGRIEPPDDKLKDVLREIFEDPPLDPFVLLGNDDVEPFVTSWTRALRRSVILFDPPPVRVLCAFGSVADAIYRLDAQGAELQVFLEWARKELGLASIDALIYGALKALDDDQKLLEMTHGDGVATDLVQVVALIIWCMRHVGRKPVLFNVEVQRQMLEYVRWRRQQRDPEVITNSLGGASGNMCYVLRHLGLDVVAHWPYHHELVAEPSPPGLRRLISRTDSKEEVPAGQPGFYFDGQNRLQKDPVRQSVSFEFPAGLTLFRSGTKPESSDERAIAKTTTSGRAIFQVPVFRSQTRPWQQVTIRVPTSSGPPEDLTVHPKDVQREFDSDGWPFLPLFSHWTVKDDALVVEVTDDRGMEHIGRQVDYFILAGPHALGSPIMKSPLRRGKIVGPSLRTVVKHHLIRQLQVLIRCGVVIHTEIPSMKPDVFDDVGEVIRGRVRSVGLNDDDLLRVTGEDEYRGTRFFHSTLNDDEKAENRRCRSVFQRTQRAGHLARELGVEQLYVHGTDVDVIRRRGVPRGALWREMDANLLAKAAVVLALKQRVPPTGATVPLTPILKRDGMLAFLQFAVDLVRERHPHDVDRQQQLFRQILRSKLVFDRSADEYSTLVTPVFWPDQPPEITAGAGDMTSGVVAVFSGK